MEAIMSRIRSRFTTTITLVVIALVMMTSAPAMAAVAPTTPTDLRVVDLWSTSLTVAWNPSTDSTGRTLYYEVSIDTPDPWTATPVATSQRFDGLGAGQTYTFSVRAVNQLGNRSASATLSFTTPTGPQPPPAAPVNLRPVYVNGVLDALAWDAPAHNAPLSYSLYSGPTVLANVSTPGISVAALVNDWCVESARYTFVVQANDSAHSRPLTVTIPAPLT
jgi:predicted phage tail protein